jgi:DNA-binding ferritin-like protein (Dps family)
MMGLKETFEEKKEWRDLQKRANLLPNEYKIVYKEIQKYFMKVDPVNLTSDFQPLYELLNLFEDSAKQGKQVLQITGEDVAAFADELLPEETFIDSLGQDQTVKNAVGKWLDKL